MAGTIKETPIEQIVVEHYLFDLGYPIETVSEISGKDEEYVRKIHDDYVRAFMGTRSDK